MTAANNDAVILALESSTPHGGAALIRNGEILGARLLPEGLRHGRELLPSAADLMADFDLKAGDLAGIAVSAGPGSYTGLRVGVMSAKALAYGAAVPLATVSSLAGHAASLRIAAQALPEDVVAIIRDARRDEVYVGVYRVLDDTVEALRPDFATTPEEAASLAGALLRRDAGIAGSNSRIRLAGSGLATYRDIFAANGVDDHNVSIVPPSPGGIGWLGRRQILREETADPLLAQPVYLRRDDGADWTHDSLIT